MITMNAYIFTLQIQILWHHKYAKLVTLKSAKMKYDTLWLAFSSSFIFLATSQIAFQNTFMTLNYHGRYRYTTLMGFIFGYIVVFTWLILRSKDNYSILILYSILLLLESLDVFVCRVHDTIFSGSTSNIILFYVFVFSQPLLIQCSVDFPHLAFSSMMKAI